jgi:hypothetical protein
MPNNLISEDFELREVYYLHIYCLKICPNYEKICISVILGILMTLLIEYGNQIP